MRHQVPEEQHTQCGIVPTEQVNVYVFNYVGVVVFCWSNCSNWIPRHSSCRRILPAPVLGSATQNFLLSKHGRPRYGWQFGFLPQGTSSGIQAPLTTTINNISLINQSIIYECSICNKEITDKHYSLLCHLQSDTNHWIHKKCTKTVIKDYHPAWKCP